MFTRGVLALTIPVLGTPPWGLSYPHPGIIGHVQVQPPKKNPLTLHIVPNIYIYIYIHSRYIHIYIYYIYDIFPCWWFRACLLSDLRQWSVLYPNGVKHIFSVFGMDWESPTLDPLKSKGLIIISMTRVTRPNQSNPGPVYINIYTYLIHFYPYFFGLHCSHRGQNKCWYVLICSILL